MAAKKNFYAVKNGRKTGIFHSWSACKEQIDHFAGALYKGFATLPEAESYLGAEKPLAASDEESLHYAYVDGSYIAGKYSWAIAVYYKGDLIHTASGVGQSVENAKMNNVAGEIEAAMQAAEWARKNKIDEIIICHDYIGISEWAQGRWKTNTPGTAQYAAFMQDYKDIVRFKKVAGHTGIPGNELVDKLAKKELGI
ncbi:ribonuclease H1 domain-containing protein [Pectinatus haikarae]|uniref:ribonuclease H n=1 Tax=Pectinatus haikarae TaxID=349096 RepID=A0ABT9Y8A4_9FIRM|nr:ribonuclease H family protein [Pectinatus haikarae]MDQ0203730.1 ribonuclease HI [Pectinatus haikarae]